MTIILTALAIVYWPITLFVASIYYLWPLWLVGVVWYAFYKLSGRSERIREEEERRSRLTPEQIAEEEKQAEEQRIQDEKDTKAYHKFILFVFGSSMIMPFLIEFYEKGHETIAALMLLLFMGLFVFGLVKYLVSFFKSYFI